MRLVQRILAIAFLVSACGVADEPRTILVTHAQASTAQDRFAVTGLSEGQPVNMLVDSVFDSHDTTTSDVPSLSPKDICFRCDEPPCGPCRCERIACPD